MMHDCLALANLFEHLPAPCQAPTSFSWNFMFVQVKGSCQQPGLPRHSGFAHSQPFHGRAGQSLTGPVYHKWSSCEEWRIKRNEKRKEKEEQEDKDDKDDKANTIERRGRCKSMRKVRRRKSSKTISCLLASKACTPR